MITEDYVSFEIAKLLKEKGFDWRESPFYSEQDRDEWRQNNSYTIPNMEYNPDYPFDSEVLTMVAPHVSIQMAMKWLREVHNIAISVYVFNRDIPIEEGNIIYTCDIATVKKTSREGHLRLAGPYEDACEAAIKYCLKELI